MEVEFNPLLVAIDENGRQSSMPFFSFVLVPGSAALEFQ